MSDERSSNGGFLPQESRDRMARNVRAKMGIGLPERLKSTPSPSNLLTIHRDGKPILSVMSGDMVLAPGKEADRQYALDLIFNALAALTAPSPPYSTASKLRPSAKSRPNVEGEDIRSFRPYSIPTGKRGSISVGDPVVTPHKPATEE